MRNLPGLIVVAAALAVPSANNASWAAPGGAVAPGKAYDGWVQRSLYIPSADGTRLAITVHLPSRGGVAETARLPVIVTQDRSASNPGADAMMRRFTDRGYVWVSQDRRGTGASFGVQTGFVNELDAMDAKAVIEWSAAQPFATGKVVATGCSNQGAWQYLTATLAPKGLVAIAPSCASPMFYDDAVAMNGIPIAPLAPAAYAGECNRPPSGARPAGFVPPPPRPVDEDRSGELLSAAIAGQKCGAAMLGQYWLNMPRDGFNAFARNRPALDNSAAGTGWQAVCRSRVAILQLGGWYDAAVAGQIEGQAAWGGRIVMGPWVHGNRAPRGAAFPNGDMDLVAETLRWFDFHAKGIRNGADRPGMTWYTFNAPAGREWRTAPEFPRLAKTSLWFAGEGRLAPSRPGAAAPAVYPQQPVRWFGGQYAPLARWSAADMAASDAASLVHTAAPFARETEVTGAVTADLWVSADAPDVNVFAMLEDVDPSGRATYVSDGRLRASWRTVSPLPWQGARRTWHRGLAADIVPLTPGKPERLVFDFFPTSYVFKAGHSLRVALATTIGEAGQAPPLAGGKAPTLSLWRDAAHPSGLRVPIVR